MPLTLTIRNVGRLDNGSPLSLVLDRRGAIIGRAATCDWCLPDPSLHVSSRHCVVRFADVSFTDCLLLCKQQTACLHAAI